MIYLFSGFGFFLFAGISAHVGETLILMSFGYVGILTHYIKKWSEKVEKDETMNVRKTIPSIILSVITTTVLIILRAEIESLFVFTRFGSFIVGYFGNSWFFGFIEKKMYNINPQIDEKEI
jgi:tetrahydromethanopterin S-methyltransferase subunit E